MQGPFSVCLNPSLNIFILTKREKEMFQDCPTCYLGDGNLAAADPFTSLTERFNLDHIALVDRQRQLQRGVVGLHHVGTTVFVLAVHHLKETECE